MGINAFVHLCVKDEKGNVVKHSVVEVHSDGNWEALGVLLASFLDGRAEGFRKAVCAENLFMQINALLHPSPLKTGGAYQHSTDETGSGNIYRIIVDDESGDVTFEAEGEWEEEEGELVERTFSGTPGDFVKNETTEFSRPYRPALPQKKRSREELEVEKKSLIKKFKTLAADIDEGDIDAVLLKRDELVSYLDAIAYA